MNMRSILSARRGIIFLFVALVSLVFFLISMQRDIPIWYGWFPATAGIWAQLLLIVFSLGAFCGAAISSSYRAKGLDEIIQTSGRSRKELLFPIVLRTWGVVFSVSIIVLISCGVIALLAKDGQGVEDLPAILILCLQEALACGFFIALGVELGMRFPVYISAPLSLTIPYVYAGLIGSMGGVLSLGGSWAYYMNLDWAPFRSTWVTLLIRMTFWGTALLVMLLVVAQLKKYLRTAIIAMVIVASISSWYGIRTQTIPGAEEPVCANAEYKVVVCTPKYASAGLDGYMHSVNQTLGDLPDSLRPDAVIGVFVNDDFSSRLGNNIMVAPSVNGWTANVNIVDPIGVREEISGNIFKYSCGPESVGSDASSIIFLWWWQESNVDETKSDMYLQNSSFESMDGLSYIDEANKLSSQTTRTEMLDWLDAHSQNVLSCSVKLDDLP